MSAAECHDYAAHLGPLNSSHFLPQARVAYQRYHAAAVKKAYQRADVRQRLAAAPASLASYASDCDVEAFVFEAVAHHFLQDASSTGHMWQRWGGTNPDDFPGGTFLSRDQMAVAVAATTGLIHGARAVIEQMVPDVYWSDPLSAPLDVMRFPVDGVLNPVQYADSAGGGLAIHAGVGDMYVSLMESDYLWQYQEILDCERRSIQEVAGAAGLPFADVSALPDTGSQAFLDRCFGKRVTNESMLLGYALDGIRGTTHVRVPLDDVGGALTVVLPTTSGVGFLASDIQRLGYDVAVIGNVIRTEVALNPFGTNLADGGLPPLLGVSPNDAYLRDPLARYSDPALPFALTFGGSPDAVEPENIIGRAFHRGHARDWCAVASGADLESLRGTSGFDTEGMAARCQICMEIGGRHVRIGRNAADYDRSHEPLCAYLVDGAAFVYVDTDSGNPLEATQRWCGCGADQDGGMDGGPDAPSADGAGSGGATGAGSPGGGGSTGSGTPGGGGSTGGAGTGGTTGGGGAGGSGAAGASGMSGSGGGNAGASGAGGNAGAGGASGAGGNPGAGGASGAGGNDDWGWPACMGNPEQCDAYNRTPPPPIDFNAPLGPHGGSFGDPHVLTLDGLLFNFQAVGEFVLISDGADLLVQARQGRWSGTSDTVAGIAALAARVGGHRVTIDASAATPVSIDGSPVSFSAQTALPGGGSIEPLPHAYLLRWPDGEQMHVRLVDLHLDVLFQAASTPARRFVGILGDGDGETANDLALRDGTVLSQPVPRGVLYTTYADSWRLRQEESLFDYPAGLGTADFTDRSFPPKVASAALLSAAEHAEGMKLCSDYGVVTPALLNECALDYALTKDLVVVRAFQGVRAPLAVNPSVDYRNDFEGAEPDGALSPTTIGEVPATARLTPNRFAGPFTDGRVTLSVSGLPVHTMATVAFDLYIMGPWSGEVWSLADRDDRLFMSASFDNLGGEQSYPDFVNVGRHPSRAGASLVDALGAIPDAVYHQRYTFAHTGDLALTFIGPAPGADPGVRWGIDNVEVLADTPAGVSTTIVNGITVAHGAGGPADVIGCADGHREAFLDEGRYPRIAGCQATWTTNMSLRTPPTGAACGDELGACATPADACAFGWHLCGLAGDPAELTASISADDCELAGPGSYVTAMSHCNGPSSVCGYVDQPGETLACFESGWCAEPVCCGNNCRTFGTCKDGVWLHRTHIPSNLTGCGRKTAVSPGGVLCCR